MSNKIFSRTKTVSDQITSKGSFQRTDKMGRSMDVLGDHSHQAAHILSTEISLKPILLSMKICGMYLHPIPWNNSVEDMQYRGKERSHITSILSRVYCYIVLLMMWFNCVRLAVSLFPLEQGTSLLVIPTVWFLQCAVNATIMVISCHRLQGLKLFYKHWDSIFQDSGTENIRCNYKRTSKSSRLILLIGWILFLVINVFINFMILQSHVRTLQIIGSFIASPFPNELWPRILSAIFVFHQTGAWLFPVILLLAVSQMITSQFSHFKESLSRHGQEANGSLPSCLPELRSHYLKLSTAVELINETFKWIMGFSMLFSICMACFTSYHLISRIPENTVTSAVFIAWLVLCFLYLLVLTLSASHLHTTAQSSLGVLITTGTREATPEYLGQLNLFITKLTAAPVGFTVVDFFLITKEFFLTVTGLYVTYLLIILQLKID